MLMDYMDSNNLIGEVHVPPMKKVGHSVVFQKKWLYLSFVASYLFHKFWEVVLQITNVIFNANTKPDVHFIVSGEGIFVNI